MSADAQHLDARRSPAITVAGISARVRISRKERHPRPRPGSVLTTGEAGDGVSRAQNSRASKKQRRT